MAQEVRDKAMAMKVAGLMPALGRVAETRMLISRLFKTAGMPFELIVINDGDIPTLPDQFVDIIMHGAKVYYGQSVGATEVYDSGKDDGARMMTDLEADQLPPPAVPAPML